jgi:hypothetical protein
MNPFYRGATFFSADEVRALMEKIGLSELTTVRTLLGVENGPPKIESLRMRSAAGAFAVRNGKKKNEE